MKARKDNREYTISTESEIKAYQARGFDIYNDDGTVKAYGAGKQVSMEEYVALKTENAKLTAENKRLKKDLKAAEKAVDVEKGSDPVKGE